MVHIDIIYGVEIIATPDNFGRFLDPSDIKRLSKEGNLDDLNFYLLQAIDEEGEPFFELEKTCQDISHGQPHQHFLVGIKRGSVSAYYEDIDYQVSIDATIPRDLMEEFPELKDAKDWLIIRR